MSRWELSDMNREYGTTANDAAESRAAARFDGRELRRIGTEFYDVDRVPALSDIEASDW